MPLVKVFTISCGALRPRAPDRGNPRRLGICCAFFEALRPRAPVRENHAGFPGPLPAKSAGIMCKARCHALRRTQKSVQLFCAETSVGYCQRQAQRRHYRKIFTLPTTSNLGSRGESPGRGAGAGSPSGHAARATCAPSEHTLHLQRPRGLSDLRSHRVSQISRSAASPSGHAAQATPTHWPPQAACARAATPAAPAAPALRARLLHRRRDFVPPPPARRRYRDRRGSA